jgi:hypothetical protein
VIYDKKTGPARLIDFEIVHKKSLPTKSRHADDLLVFLLDLLARAPNAQWLTLVLAFGRDSVRSSNKFRKSRECKTASSKDRGRGR